MPATDQERLLVSIEATQRRFEKQMAAVAKAAGDSAKGVEATFKKANDNVERGFQKQTKAVEQSAGQQRAAIQNLSFQLNDITSSLLGGASPFTVMIQQGSQVSQIFQGSGGIIGAVKTLGAAAATMVNPVSLASFAMIGLAGAAVQYFSEWASSGDATAEDLQKQADLIQRVAARLGDASPVLQDYADKLKRIADEQDRINALKAVKVGVSSDVQTQFSALSSSIVDQLQLVPDANREYGVLANKIEAGTAKAEDFQRVIDALNKVLLTEKSEGIEKAVSAIERMQASFADSQGEIKRADKELNTLTLTAQEAKDAGALLASQFLGLGAGGADAIKKAAEAVTANLNPGLSDALDWVKKLVANFDTLQTQVNQTRLGALSPLYSGGGRFLNEGEVGASRANEDEMKRVGESAAAVMIKRLESFQPTGKWDVNAYRAGYGSDTTTRANGDVVKVTEGMIVTLDEAERDLARRLVEFQSGIKAAIGEDTWRSLNEAQQAALTSIAYNYGSLPNRIVQAIQSGGGPEVVAKAIADLGSDNGGVNKNRRRNEAQSYLSGSGYSMSDVGLGDNKRRSPSEVFQGDLSKVQERIDLLTAEYQAQANLNPAVNDYGFALEKARIQQQLLADAQRAGVEVTPALKAQIETLSTAYAKASASGDELKASQERARDAAQEFATVGKDLVGGFISDLRAGKSAAEAFGNVLSKLADKFIDAGLDGLFGGGQGGGIFSSLFSGLTGGKSAFPAVPGGLYAKGGIANQPSIFGEAGPEAAVPLPDGRRIPVVLKGPRNPGPSRPGRPVYQTVRGGDLIIQGDVRDTATVDEIDRRIRANNKSIAYAQSNAWRTET